MNQAPSVVKPTSSQNATTGIPAKSASPDSRDLDARETFPDAASIYESATLLAWARMQPWAKAMAECPQDPVRHAEGDVWTHTENAIGALEELKGFQRLPLEERRILLWGALLHDIGKPSQTVVHQDNGRIRCPDHARVGARLTRLLLAELEFDIHERERIVRLVRWHNAPAGVFLSDHAGRRTVELSWRAEPRLQCILAKADMAGRISTKSNDDEADRVEQWRQLASELGCFDRPFTFHNDHARFLYFHGQRTRMDECPAAYFSCTATMMCGLPGAGKDTWIKANIPNQKMVSLDEIRKELDHSPRGDQTAVVQTARDRCRRYLRDGSPFVLNATNITRAIRNEWISLFHQYQARIRIVYLEPTLSTVFRQNAQRDPAAVVPDPVIWDFFNTLDYPTMMECHELDFPMNPPQAQTADVAEDSALRLA